MDKKIIISIVINIVVVITAAIFDLVLDLGNFSGLVFALYSYYGLGIIFLVYLILGFWKKEYFKLLITPTIFAIIIYVISVIMQS